MALTDGSVDVSAKLSAIKHELKNQNMKSLPAKMTVQRRPLYHAPIVSSHAGSQVQKVVYVSTHTPVMAAVKRVRKYLSQIEQRAGQSSENIGDGRRLQRINNKNISANVSTALKEEILVKGSGRAMQQALRVGEWFRSREKEMICEVKVRPGSVQAVDDIVEVEEPLREQHEDLSSLNSRQDDAQEKSSTVLEGGETTMELLGNITSSLVDKSADKSAISKEVTKHAPNSDGIVLSKKRKRSRRKRAVYEEEEIPEARLRWVKTVEVAISLKTG